MARPQKIAALTAEQIEQLAAVGCTDSEIAALAGMGERTLQDRFRTQLKDGRARLRSDLRKAQIDRAKNGSDTMLIWLGKQYLGQRDKVDNEQSGAVRVEIVYADAPAASRGTGEGEA